MKSYVELQYIKHTKMKLFWFKRGDWRLLEPLPTNLPLHTLYPPIPMSRIWHVSKEVKEEKGSAPKTSGRRALQMEKTFSTQTVRRWGMCEEQLGDQCWWSPLSVVEQQARNDMAWSYRALAIGRTLVFTLSEMGVKGSGHRSYLVDLYPESIT